MKKKNLVLYSILIAIICPLTANDATVFHRYFWANYKHFSGNIPHAHDWYKRLFSCDNSVYTYKGYLTFLASTNQFKQIIDLMPSLSKKFAQDPDVQLSFVLALQKTKQLKKADDLIISLSQSFKTHSEIALLAAQTYMQKKEPENALLTIDAFLNNTARRPNNFVFYFLKSHIYVQVNQFSQALENIQKCLELHPHFDKGWLLCASLYEKEGKIKEALSGYTTFLELSGGNSQVEQHLMTLMLKHKSIEDNKHNFLSHKVGLDNALILFKQQRYTSALTHISSCLEQDPTNNEYRLLKIQILAAMKNFNHAASTLSAWIKETPESDIWPKTLHLLAYNGMPQNHKRFVQSLHNNQITCGVTCIVQTCT
jgi:predicted Zn-dependent protease